MNLPDHVAEAAFFALDHAIECVSAGETLVPFVIIEQDGKRSLHRIIADELGQAAVEARKFALRSIDDAGMVTVTLDGFITIHGERSDAIFAEVYWEGGSEGISIVQRYKRGRFKKFTVVGNLTCIGRVDLEKTNLKWEGGKQE